MDPGPQCRPCHSQSAGPCAGSRPPGNGGGSRGAGGAWRSQRGEGARSGAQSRELHPAGSWGPSTVLGAQTARRGAGDVALRTGAAQAQRGGEVRAEGFPQGDGAGGHRPGLAALCGSGEKPTGRHPVGLLPGPPGPLPASGSRAIPVYGCRAPGGHGLGSWEPEGGGHGLHPTACMPVGMELASGPAACTVGPGPGRGLAWLGVASGAFSLHRACSSRAHLARKAPP